MSLETIKERLVGVRGKALIPEALGDEAVELAADLLRLARRRMKARERRQGKKLARMMDDPRGKALTLQLADQVFRSHTHRKAASQFRHLLHDHGVPRYLPVWERAMMAAGGMVSLVAPGLVMPLVSRKMRAESRAVIVPAESEPLGRYVNKRRGGGVDINLNQLGEAVLGEEEAARRLDAIIGRLRSPLVDYVSVKLSAIYSQINLLAGDAVIDELKARLRAILRAVKENPFLGTDGRARPKFVNLDMEEYRDLHLTTNVFRSVLDEPEFVDVEAGIVLQAYLPDSADVQEDLTAWAEQRVERGGVGIKIRLVKGANLAMERVEASLHGWSQAPYGEKRDVDANYKRMINFGCRKENAAVVRLGIGSHNLFDVAYAMLAAEMHGVTDRVDFEMLEGMANHQMSAVDSAAGSMRVYTPVVREGDFHSALAYLVRRLDENTDEENFLRHLFPMKVGSPSWDSEKAKFIKACERVETVSSRPRRNQDRGSELNDAEPEEQAFRNAPDTDWSVPANRDWVMVYLEKWKNHRPDPVGPQVGGHDLAGGSQVDVHDPSRPGHVAYRYGLATAEDVNEALRVAGRAQHSWSLKPFADRARVLRSAAAVFARERGDTIGCMVLDGAKAIPEADAEVSEAIDFANYYARTMDLEGIADCESTGRGVVVVAPPWNFPYAIPASGVLAALVAGNSVILKPAPQAVLSSAYLARQLWDAGVPKEVLQFLPCPDNDIGRGLITDRRVDSVVLTGAYETGKAFQAWKPDMRLLAETSGKNAMVITAAADVEQAIKDLVRSAFGHAGQKCSAASLALVEDEVYDRLSFRRQLRDAAQSLKVGSAWDPQSVVTPLISPPNERLARAQSSLDEGEEWLLEPRRIDQNPCLWSPGIKLGVRPGGRFFSEECFGPVLGVMRVKNLAEAIELQNSSEFGLTGGLQSLDPREIETWSEQVEVGNAYVNRPCTGAIVQRQPFGGWGHSAFGPGGKAGGPDYVMAFAHWEQTSLPDLRESPGEVANQFLGEIRKKLISARDRERIGVAAWNYGWAYRKVFSVETDKSKLHGERNVLRYRARRRMLYRIGSEQLDHDGTLVTLASAVTGVPVEISVPSGADLSNLEPCKAVPGVAFVSENADELGARLTEMNESKSDSPPSAIRTVEALPRVAFEAANALHAPIIDGSLLANGRVELRHWFEEQALSETTHRYGNLLPRFREGLNGDGDGGSQS